jgi:hypothetical protein
MKHKVLRFTKFQIRVAGIQSPVSSDPFISSIEALAIFPGCRKVKTCFFSVTAGAIWAQPLYGYNGRANIAPDDWRRWCASADVVSCRVHPYAITADVIARARKLEAETADAAERQLLEAHPNYRPEICKVVDCTSADERAALAA